MFRAAIFTLYPDFFPGPLGQSLSGDALTRGLWALETRQIRDHGLGRHKSVDDSPAGGGPIFSSPNELQRIRKRSIKGRLITAEIRIST